MLLTKGGGFSIPEPSINRLPENVIWGYIVAQNENGFNLGKALVNAWPQLNELIPPGHYGHLTMSSQQEVSILHSPNLPFKIVFAASNDDKKQIIESLQILS